jgi:hypothetical protein
MKQAHLLEVDKLIEENGRPESTKYKFDSMSGRHGAHNTHLFYPDKKITINTQMYNSGPCHNVFIMRGMKKENG